MQTELFNQSLNQFDKRTTIWIVPYKRVLKLAKLIATAKRSKPQVNRSWKPELF